jgi:predicted nucleotidyltransferase
MSARVERRFVEFWRERDRILKSRDERAARQAESDLERIVDLLVRRFGAERIILFGSLARGHFSDESDIDLAVEGISRRDYFEARVDQVSRLIVGNDPDALALSREVPGSLRQQGGLSRPQESSNDNHVHSGCRHRPILLAEGGARLWPE